MALNITGYGNYGRLLTNLEHAAAGNDRQAAVQAYNAINKSASYTQRSAHGTAKDQLLLGRFSKVYREQGDQGIARLTDAVQRVERASQAIRTRFNHDNGFSTTTKVSTGIGALAVAGGVAKYTGVADRIASAVAPNLPNIPSLTSLTSSAGRIFSGYGGYVSTAYGAYGASLATRATAVLGSIPGSVWVGAGIVGLGAIGLLANRYMNQH